MTEEEFQTLKEDMEQYRIFTLERKAYKAKSEKHIGFVSTGIKICQIEERLFKHIPKDILFEACERL